MSNQKCMSKDHQEKKMRRDLLKFAKEELATACGDFEDDEMQLWANNCIYELLELLDKQRHSAYSAAYVIKRFNMLANFESLDSVNDDADSNLKEEEC